MNKNLEKLQTMFDNWLTGFAKSLDEFDRERERRHFYEQAEMEPDLKEWVFIGYNMAQEGVYELRADNRILMVGKDTLHISD